MSYVDQAESYDRIKCRAGRIDIDQAESYDRIKCRAGRIEDV